MSSTEHAEDDHDEDVDNYKEEIDRLIRRHRNEKFAPELLSFDQEVVESISELLHFVEKSLLDDRASGEQDPTHPSFYLRSTDADRLTYLLSDYLRIRLQKLQKYPLYYLEPERQHLLSSSERVWLRDFWDNKRLYLENRCLLALPESKQRLDQKVDEQLDMVRSPCLDAHVYVRMHAKLERSPSTQTGTEGSSVGLELNEGDTYLLRYNVVRQFLMQPEHDGKVELV